MAEPTSVGNLISEAEEREFKEKVRAAMRPPLTTAEIMASLKAMTRSKVWWIDKFSTGPKKRPESEIIARRHELAVLVQVAARLKQGNANETSETT